MRPRIIGEMLTIATAIGILALAFGWFAVLQRVREKAMLSLATQLGFEYLDRTVPSTFPNDEEPLSEIRSMWNIIHGRQKGAEIVVFDGISGKGRGVYHTFIAVRTTEDPFPRDEALLGNISRSSGWAVLCGEQQRLNLIPWSISLRGIKQYLHDLNL
jgi:hypothetical protein